MNLTEVLAALGAAPAKEREEVSKAAIDATKDKVWIPNPGPQTEAYFSQADELFFGGQAGGGKSDLEIGLALTAHTRSLILRRTHKEAAGLVERIADILGNRDGWSGQAGTWRLGDKVIDIGGCLLEEDRQKYKGVPHSLICVGRGTPVLMADGGYRAVEDVRVGDNVATLEGPRVVKRSFPVFGRESVAMTVRTPEGPVTQVQSATHKVLARTGWASPDTLNAALSCSAATCASEYHYPNISCANTSYIRESVSLDQRSLCQLGQSNEQLKQDAHGTCKQRRLQELIADRAPLTQGTYAVVFGGARVVSALGDFLNCCLACFHSYGGRTPSRTGYPTTPTGAPQCLPQLVGVVQQNPTCLQVGASGRTHGCTHLPLEYPHPYTKDVRLSQLPLISCAFTVAPVGVADLFDLEVDEVNHFITHGGIINKNCFDEVSDFSESQYLFINAWNRSATGERCRVVAAGNPPTRPEGMWVTKRWAAWLDPKHPNPAQPGELRWYTTGAKGEDIEVDGKGPHDINGDMVTARSRTFIPSKLSDNPDLAATDYAATLAALPPELRAAYRDGIFSVGLEDGEFQTIPSAWVAAAQARWTPQPPIGAPMCCIGVDVAQCGKDKTVLAIRHDAWYNTLIVVPGIETPDGKKVAGLVVAHRRDSAKVVIDIGGGWGGDAFAHMRENGIDAASYMGVKKSVRRTVDGLLKFTNIRTEAYWRFREALDPSQPNGSQIALPRDNLLVADLCAPTYGITSNGLAIESKVAVCKRLGRSPDRGDAVIMAWFDGLKQANSQGGWTTKSTRPNTSIMGRNHR